MCISNKGGNLTRVLFGGKAACRCIMCHCCMSYVEFDETVWCLQLVPHGSVATDSPHCSVIGTQILKNGGNSVDAAVASSFCLGVVNPHATGLGGWVWHSMNGSVSVLCSSLLLVHWWYSCASVCICCLTQNVIKPGTCNVFIQMTALPNCLFDYGSYSVGAVGCVSWWELLHMLWIQAHKTTCESCLDYTDRLSFLRFVVVFLRQMPG